jgi:hypothetical protein
MTPRLPALSQPARSHLRTTKALGGPVGASPLRRGAGRTARGDACSPSPGASTPLEGVASGAAWLQERNDAAARAAERRVATAALARRRVVAAPATASARARADVAPSPWTGRRRVRDAVRERTTS